MYRGKRVLDFCIAIVALVVLAPVMAVCAALVRFSSRGPVIYAGERIGLHERRFWQLKFRTMAVDADRHGFQTAEGDPRITPIGRWLRKTSLDELPQIVNVLRGEMSVVGPRPAALAQLALYDDAQRRARASVRPGITGLAQVSGRSALPLADAVARDLEYVRGASLWFDLRILRLTVQAVAGRSGTN